MAEVATGILVYESKAFIPGETYEVGKYDPILGFSLNLEFPVSHVSLESWKYFECYNKISKPTNKHE